MEKTIQVLGEQFLRKADVKDFSQKLKDYFIEQVEKLKDSYSLLAVPSGREFPGRYPEAA